MTWLEAIVLLIMTVVICLITLVGWIAYLRYRYEEKL